MLPYPWRVSIGGVRAALGAGCLLLYVASSRTPFSWALVPLLGYVIYAFFAIRKSTETDGAPLLTLSIDTICFIGWFLLTANSGYGGALWLALNGAVYIFLLSSAIVNQEWPKALGVAGACIFAAFLAPSDTSILQPIMIWCAVIAAVWVLHRRFLEARLSRAARHSVMYRFEAQQAREDERQRMAADFHDGPLQSFIGFQMRLEILKKMLARDPNMALEELKELQELCRSQVGELRAFVRSMRPADVDGSSLGASISRMVEQFQKDTGITASFRSGDYLDPAETEVSLEILQIVREALNNVQKHAHASRVAVSINKRGEYIEIGVDDNGAGFPFSGSYTLEELDLLRLGPVSIRRRVRALGGDLSIESRPGQGAGVKVRVALS